MSYLSPELQAALDQLNNKPKEQPKQESRNDSGISPQLQKMLDQLGQSRIDSVLDNWYEHGFTSRLDAEMKLNYEATSQERKDASESLTDRRRQRPLPAQQVESIGHNPKSATNPASNPNQRTDAQSISQKRRNRPLPTNNY